MKVVFHEDFYRVYTCDPAAAEGRMEAIVEEMESRTEYIDAEPATEEQISLVHDARHIESVRNTGLYDIAALAAGGGYFAVLEGGYNHDVLGANAKALIDGMSGN